jgi:RNA polymerase II subunit A small phosphatase-like protein
LSEVAAILLILDIDETLLYASEKRLERDPEFRVGQYFVYVRPFLREFLQRCEEHFRLAIWSSSSADYLNAIVEKVLPRELTLEFVWSRERCIQRFSGETQELYYVKDLKKVCRKGYDLDRVLIVDDSPEKVERNYGNAIYVRPFFGAADDDELRNLGRYLKSVAQLTNVRCIEKRDWRKTALQLNSE